MSRPVLGVTMGDAAGVGPEIIARAAAEPAVRASCRPVVIGAAEAMGEALALVGSPLALHAVPSIAECRWADDALEVIDLGNVDMATLPRGEVSAAAGRAAYEYIERAVALTQSGQIEAIVQEDPFYVHGLADFRIIEFRASQRANDIQKRIERH